MGIAVQSLFWGNAGFISSTVVRLSKASGRKDYTLTGIWFLEPYYLVIWTLRIRCCSNLIQSLI